MSDIDDAAAARFHPELMRPSDDEDEVRILGYGYFDETEARFFPPSPSFCARSTMIITLLLQRFVTNLCNECYKPL